MELIVEYIVKACLILVLLVGVYGIKKVADYFAMQGYNIDFDKLIEWVDIVLDDSFDTIVSTPTTSNAGTDDFAVTLIKSKVIECDYASLVSDKELEMIIKSRLAIYKRAYAKE